MRTRPKLPNGTLFQPESWKTKTVNAIVQTLAWWIIRRMREGRLGMASIAMIPLEREAAS